MSTPIRFGTDGWRAIIGEEFTPENIVQVIQAFCDLEGSRAGSPKHIIVGYDRRRQSKETAEMVSEVLLGNSFLVELSSQFCPTPCISWMTKNSPASHGIVITASHNPSQWNGIKFKESYGGSASPSFTKEIERKIEDNQKHNRTILRFSLQEGLKQQRLKYFDPVETYGKQLLSLVDGKLIQQSNLKVLHDPLFGAGSHFLTKLFPEQIDEMHAEADVTFGGLNPEPIESNLSVLQERVVRGGYALGLATDGDADRIGAVDDEGHFVNSHQIFALLLKHHVEYRKLTGLVVKSLSTTQMVRKQCEKYALPLVETPVGFKYICEELIKNPQALMGGEESGGISFGPHVHERDGLLNGLFLLEMMSVQKKSLRELLKDLEKEMGSFFYKRIDLHIDTARIQSIKEKLTHLKVDTLAGLFVVETRLVDGFYYRMQDGSWALIRSSGTEPLVRLYAEADSLEKVEGLLQAIQVLVGEE